VTLCASHGLPGAFGHLIGEAIEVSLSCSLRVADESPANAARDGDVRCDAPWISPASHELKAESSEFHCKVERAGLIRLKVIARLQESPARLQQVCWYALIGLLAAGIGYFLATSYVMLALAFMGTAWLVSLPYHCQISVRVAVATFTSALILPFFPGRPYLWESAALLGWSGLPVMFAMRRYAPGAFQQLKQNIWLFMGVAGYCLVLLLTMYYRGFGLRIFGGEQMGGRFYFQQLSCAVFPLLFVVCRIDEKTVVRLFTLQCVLTVTYVVSDFVFALPSGELYVLLQFFELPGDAIGFEMQAQHFGIRRFQSLYFLSGGMLYLILTRYNLKNLFTPRGLFLIPLIVFVMAIGSLSGHRYLVLIVFVMLLFCAYAQRFYTVKHCFISAGACLILVAFLYGFGSHLPLAAQRVASVLPGINIDPEAKADAWGTWEMRRIMRKVGLELAPQYLWLGRGFGQSSVDYSFLWDPTAISSHIAIGRFYNGIVGLLVNTGIFGTAFMLLFLGGGTALALKIVRLLRTNGCEDNFERVCSLLSGLWMADVIAFLFLHGDSEYAMKTFSLNAGMLLICHYHLNQRQLIAARQP